MYYSRHPSLRGHPLRLRASAPSQASVASTGIGAAGMDTFFTRTAFLRVVLHHQADAWSILGSSWGLGRTYLRRGGRVVFHTLGQGRGKDVDSGGTSSRGPNRQISFRHACGQAPLGPVLSKPASLPHAGLPSALCTNGWSPTLVTLHSVCLLGRRMSFLSTRQSMPSTYESFKSAPGSVQASPTVEPPPWSHSNSSPQPISPAHCLFAKMIWFLFQAMLLCVATWMIWALTRLLLFTSPLDNIPGPPSHSFVYGVLYNTVDSL